MPATAAATGKQLTKCKATTAWLKNWCANYNNGLGMSVGPLGSPCEVWGIKIFDTDCDMKISVAEKLGMPPTTDVVISAESVEVAAAAVPSIAPVGGTEGPVGGGGMAGDGSFGGGY
jgi:hypothetical protein